MSSRGGVFVKILRRVPASTNSENAGTLAFLIGAWSHLLTDSPTDGLKPNRVIDKFINQLTHDPLKVINHFSDLAHRITLTFSHDAESGIYYVADFLTEMKDTPIFREYLHFYRTGDPHILRFILSFLLFGKKIGWNDDNLNAVAFREWQEVEEGVANLTLPDWTDVLADIVKAFFVEWDDSLFLPKHGPGSVSQEGIHGIIAKNATFSHQSLIHYLYGLRERTGYCDRAISEPWPTSTSEGDIYHADEYHSRLRFVPKDMRKTRSICMEPVPIMWAQQGVRLWIEESFEKSCLRHSVFLHDQRKNQFAAKFGSMTRTVDTIDLSSASDSVSWSLVKRIFPPKVLKHLLATRTKTVKTPGGELVELNKFAPMGSALCFPIQCTVFSAVVILAGILYRWGIEECQPDLLSGLDVSNLIQRTFRTSLLDVSEDHRLQAFFVYGDDIICDSRITSNVVDLLRALGFRVNIGKSYTGPSLFRESCGIFAFNGIDVTPLVCKTKPLTEKISVDALEGLIDFANLANSYGYLGLRRYLIRFILDVSIQGVRKKEGAKNPILFSSDPDTSLAIYTENPINEHLKTRRYEPGTGFSDIDSRSPLAISDTRILYQRNEVRSLGIGPRKKRRMSEEDDIYLHTAWWRSRYREHLESDVVSGLTKVDSLGTGVQWRWTAAEE